MNDIQLRALVLKVIKETVADTPINGFANIAHDSDYNTDNLNKRFEEYESGEFWAREWEVAMNSGASGRDTLQKEYPLLMMRIGDDAFTPNMQTFGKSQNSFKVYFELSMAVGCYKLTIGQIDKRLKCMAKRFIFELLNLRLVNGVWTMYNDNIKRQTSFWIEHVVSAEFRLTVAQDKVGTDNARLVEFEIDFKNCELEPC